MSDQATTMTLSRNARATLVVLGGLAALLFAVGRRDYPALHTILDTSAFLLSGVLALLLWDAGARGSDRLLQWLAIGFACTSTLEGLHVLVTVEWAGPFAAMAQAANVLRPSTWPPPAHVLPIAMCVALLLRKRGATGTWGVALLLVGLSVVLVFVFRALPRYTAPVGLGITRPMLLLPPFLFGAAAWLDWRYRRMHRLGSSLVVMATILAAANFVMLYSAAPHDTHAMVAHLGKVTGYLALFFFVSRVPSLDLMERRLADDRRTRSILDTALDAVITMDHEGRITEFNPSAERMFGRRRSEVAGEPLADLLIPPALRDAHRRGLSDFLRTGAGRVLGKHLELTGLRADGTEFPLEVSINQVPGDGPPVFAGFVRDISERIRDQDALRESQAHYQALAESLPHLVWTCRPDGLCDYLSHQWVEYTGLPADEQLGYGWIKQLHPDDRAHVEAAWADATKRGDTYDVEFRLRRADGAYRWFKTRAVPLRDASGQIVKWFGSNTDFDELKHGERRLRAHVERLSLLHQITRAIGERQDLRSMLQVVVHNLEDHLPVNLACVCDYDASDEALTVSCVGMKSAALAAQLTLPERAHIPIDQNGLARAVGGQLVYEPDVAEVPFPFPRRLARAGLRSVVVAPLQTASQVFGLLIAARHEPQAFSSGDCEFLRQLSEHVALALHQAQLYTALQRAYDDLRQTQQAVMSQERLRALGQMASGIAHDINNAISPVSLYAQSLLEREPNLSPRARSDLETITRAIDDVAHTVSRMREFYRQREPQLALAPVWLDMLIDQVVDLSRARLVDMPQQRGVVITVATEVAPNLPPFLGVESEIREAMVNLVFNAADAMPAGGTLTLRARSTAGAVLLEVTDTGVGMDEATRARCLEPFFTTKGERGTGLGLAMVYGVVRRHNGDLEIESAPGRGTTMRLRFTAAAAPAGAPAAPGPVATPKPTPQRLRILAVDDDPVVLQAVYHTLQADGHIVTTAGGGAAGISAFQTARERGEPFAVVITDLGMPDVDGRRVASAVKAADPSTPVIMLSGWGQRLVDEHDVPAHVDLVLNKPPKIQDLRAALAECCPPPP